jgi:PEP-CTERM motif
VRHLAIRFLSLAAFLGAAITTDIRPVRAGQVLVIENDPTPGPATVIFTGGGGLNPLPIGGAYLAPIPTPPLATPYVTPDKNFSVVGSLAWSNVGGVVVTGTLTLTVTDLLGIPGQLEVEVTQRSIVNPLVDRPGWTTTETMVGSFNNVGGVPHGNQVIAGISVSGQALPALEADDSHSPGGSFSPSLIIPDVSAPDSVDIHVDFNFLLNPVAGDSIKIPIELNTIGPQSVPEPSVLALLTIGFLGVVGYRKCLTRDARRANRRPGPILGGFGGEPASAPGNEDPPGGVPDGSRRV